MADIPVVVIGASAGGLAPLQQVLAGLGSGFRGAVFITMHLAADAISYLPHILGRGTLPVSHPKDGEAIRGGCIYVAPPDRHLLVDGERIAVKNGPKENRFRPSIDALFRSAAYNHRSNVIGVILSGSLDDGVSGLWTVKQLGGIAIVQDEKEAAYPSMPMNALDQVRVDYKLPAAEIGPLLMKLVAERSRVPPEPDAAPDRKLKLEVEIAATANAFQRGIMELGSLTPFTCPECHGALVMLTDGSMKRYRCHTGHGYTASALLAGVSEAVGEGLWQVTRAMEEAVMLLEQMARDSEARGDKEKAARFSAKAKETEERARDLQKITLSHDNFSAEVIAGKPGRH
jgi:two-component system chemotaxis response regulator CheB